MNYAFSCAVCMLNSIGIFYLSMNSEGSSAESALP